MIVCSLLCPLITANSIYHLLYLNSESKFPLISLVIVMMTYADRFKGGVNCLLPLHRIQQSNRSCRNQIKAAAVSILPMKNAALPRPPRRSRDFRNKCYQDHFRKEKSLRLSSSLPTNIVSLKQTINSSFK